MYTILCFYLNEAVELDEHNGYNYIKNSTLMWYITQILKLYCITKGKLTVNKTNYLIFNFNF